MKKVFYIALKDLEITFRDRTALLLLLLTPFLLTLGLGLVSGSFRQDDQPTGLERIPTAWVNLDQGSLGQALEAVLEAPALTDLIAPVAYAEAEAARAAVAADEVGAAIIVPADYSATVLGGGRSAIEVVENPERPISTGVVTAIATEFTSQVAINLTTVEMTVGAMIERGVITPAQAAELAQSIAQRLQTSQVAPLIGLRTESASLNAGESFNFLAFMAPGMALFFLMYGVTIGARSLLQERRQGTLARILTSPTSVSQLLGGKLMGTFLIGAVQVGILITASSLFFGLRWGDPLGVVLLTLAAALGATGWGMALAAVAQTPEQVNSVGTAMMLLFGILSGTFVPVSAGSTLAWLGRITPNKWALDGFFALGTGGGLSDITTDLLGLLALAAVLFVAAVVLFRRNWLR